MTKDKKPSKSNTTVELREADYSLQEKTGGKGALGKLFTPERIRAGQQVIEEFKTTYFEDLSAYLAELHAASSGEIEREPLLDSVKSLKGQAETLGFDFILQVCQSMYEFMSAKQEYSPTDILVIQKHAEAVLAGVRKKERGKGGMVEEETLSGLRLLRQKLAEQHG